MSKYIDMTVYEKLTGFEPPMPKFSIKKKRKRGCGHPYRMRLNTDSNIDSPSRKFVS